MATTTSVTITDNSDKVREEMEKCISRALWAVGAAAEGHAKDICPVDTGRLRNSIAHAEIDSEQTTYIGTNVEYAAFVEYGTSRMYARPYLRPAATQYGDEYKRIVEASLKAGG